MDGGFFVKSTFLDEWVPKLGDAIEARIVKNLAKAGRKWPKDTALRELSSASLAEVALPHVIMAVALNSPMIKVAKSLGAKVASVQQGEFTERDLVQIGFGLILDVIHCTKAIYLVTVTKKADGSPLKYPQYILVETQEGFIEQAIEDGALLKAICKPTPYKPVDWSTAWNGGYEKSEAVPDRRLVHTNERDILNGLSAAEQPRLFDAANTLQSVAYQVDERVLDLMQQTGA